MSEDTTQKQLMEFAFAELQKAFKDAQSGKEPTSSYNKLQNLYTKMSEVEAKRNKNQMTEEEVQTEMNKELERIKGT